MSVDLHRMQVEITAEINKFKKKCEAVKAEAKKTSDVANKALSKIGDDKFASKVTRQYEEIRKQTQATCDKVKQFAKQAQIDAGLLVPSDEYKNVTENYSKQYEQLVQESSSASQKLKKEYSKMSDSLAKNVQRVEKEIQNLKWRQESLTGTNLREMTADYKECTECIEDAKKRLEELVNQKRHWERLGGAIKSSDSFKNLEADIEEINNEIREYRNEMKWMEEEGTAFTPGKKFELLGKQIKAATEELERYKSKQASLKPDFEEKQQQQQKNYEGKFAQLKNSLEAEKAKMSESNTDYIPSKGAEGTGQAAKAYAAAGKRALTGMATEAAKAHPALQKAMELAQKFGKTAKTAGNVAKVAMKGATLPVKTLTTFLKLLGTGFGKVYQKIRSGISVLNRFRSSVKGLSNSCGGLLGKFGALRITATYMLASFMIMGGINAMKEGFKNLAQYSSRTNADLSMLMSSLTQLKNSLATAFAPILTVIAPILNTLIGWLTSATTALAHFFAALTGQSKVVVAKKVNQDFASSVADTGSAADKANKKAEKYKRTLMGFDQINKLDAPDEESGSGGSGSSGGGLSPGDMFETVEIDNKWANWADKFKEAWAKADFTEIGEMVGEKLNKALESIPWDKIKATSAKIAKSIATFLNGFIAATDWALVGGTLAEALNTVIEFAYTFVTTFDWKKFGVAIGTAINGFFAKLDLAKAGKALSEGIKGTLEMAINAVETVDWAQFGRKIADFICNIDWIGIATDIISFLGNAIVGVIDTLSGFLDQVSKYLANYIKSGEIWADLFDLGQIILDVGIRLFKSGWNLLSNFVGTLVNVGIALIKSGWSLLKDFVGDKVSAAVTLIKNDWNSLKEFVGDKVSVFVSLIKSGWSSLSNFIGTAVTIAVLLVKSGWTYLKDFVGTAVNIAILLIRSGWISLKSFVGDKVTAAISLIKSGWSSLKNFVGAKVSAGVSLVKSGWSSLKNFVGSKVSIGISLVKSGWKSLKDWVFGGIKSLALKLGLPKIKVKWSTKTFAGFKISYPSGFQTYAKGGFPEEGPFMMNRGEIAGKFRNGKSVVANNQQITDGIAAAVYQAFSRASDGNRGGITESVFLNAVNLLIAAIRESGTVLGDEEIARSAERGRAKIDRRYNPVTG